MLASLLNTHKEVIIASEVLQNPVINGSYRPGASIEIIRNKFGVLGFPLLYTHTYRVSLPDASPTEYLASRHLEPEQKHQAKTFKKSFRLPFFAKAVNIAFLVICTIFLAWMVSLFFSSGKDTERLKQELEVDAVYVFTVEEGNLWNDSTYEGFCILAFNEETVTYLKRSDPSTSPRQLSTDKNWEQNNLLQEDFEIFKAQIADTYLAKANTNCSQT